MDLLDRLLGHDTWTTRQLLLACASLPDELLDRDVAIDHRTLRATFVHMIENIEIWTDLMHERTVQTKAGETLPDLLDRLSVVSRDFRELAQTIARDQRFDACVTDTLDQPPQRKTFGGAIGHVLTHNMHHRAQIMFLMQQVGVVEHIEGDLLSWEATSFGWA